MTASGREDGLKAADDLAGFRAMIDGIGVGHLHAGSLPRGSTS